ncbi:ABC transporter permease [Geofilum rubicundum]|nr:ABC transporter permease [Geofilum rubicundum]
MLPLILVLPTVQLLILINAATMDIKNLDLTVVDQDQSPVSRRIVHELDASPFFLLSPEAKSVQGGLQQIEMGKADLVVVIPRHYEKDLIRGQSPRVQLLANAINAQQAQLGYAYLQQVVARFGSKLKMEMLGEIPPQRIHVTNSFWFNPELNYKFFMLPGILTILVSIIGLFLTAMNLVREKEMGTIEQMNVTPVHKYQFLAAKLIPFWVIGLFELTIGLVIGRLLYDVPIVGSLTLIYGLASIYLVGLLGMGLLISTFSNSQQQVAFISYFFLLIFILMSGIFTAVDNMPLWAQRINLINPVYYFIDIMRGIMLKGSGFMDLWSHVLALSVFAVVFVSLAILNYRKREG